MKINDNILSYGTILQDMQEFKGRSKQTYNQYDEPRTVFFKVIFYFNNIGNDASSWTSNLLGLDGYTSDGVVNDDVLDDTIDATNWSSTMTAAAGYSKNTAYNYLMINDELERADFLKQFILLLSEISSNSPWYFQSITGLDAAIDKPFLENQQISDERRSITIKCLPDAYDTRIGTLMDLYRAACYSNINKREVIPANLRKFDMGVYIFSVPYQGIHNKLSTIFDNVDSSSDIDAVLKGIVSTNDLSNSYFTGCKYIEFNNCEFDYKSGKDGYSEISNVTGNQLEHSINIFYDDAMESTYNEVMVKTIGDFVALDMMEIYSSTSTVDTMVNSRINMDPNSLTYDKLKSIKEIKEDNGKYIYKTLRSMKESLIGSSFQYIDKSWDEETNSYIYKDKAVESGVVQSASSSSSSSNWWKSATINALENVTGAALSKLDNIVTSFLLGNAHGFSLSDINSGVETISTGDVFGAAAAIKDQTSYLFNSSTGTNFGNAHPVVLQTSGFITTVKNNAHE